MRDYELVVIIRPDVRDEDVSQQIDRVSQWIAAASGEITNINPWGRKRLAYPIDRHREGIYVAFQFRSQPAATTALEQNLNLAEEVVRYLLIRLGE
ncbi:MAG: 30S ribosomal protein S6 [Chloroflexi bacterium]|nr:30S ribosomal protein S6 [Chloroflexota bacterium]